MVVRPSVRPFVFINDGRTKKEKGGKKKRRREEERKTGRAGAQAALMCFIVEGDRSLEACTVGGSVCDMDEGTTSSCSDNPMSKDVILPH